MSREFIEKQDSLNQGREKLNRSIDRSYDADTKSDKAIKDSNEALITSQSVRDELNQVVIDGDSSVEAAQARVGADGTNYSVLKERLDSEHGKVTTQLQQTEQELSSQLSDIISFNVENFKTPVNTYQNAVESVFTQIKNAPNSRKQFKVLFPNKVIELTSTIYVTSNTVIDLNGGTIRKANGEDFTVFNTTETNLENVTIMNGVIDGNSANLSGGINGRAIFFDNAKNLLIDNLTIKNNKTYTITVYNAIDVTIQNNKIIQEHANTGAGMILFYPNEKGNKRVRILNNYMYNVSGDNIVVGGTNNYRGADCIIHGNIIEKPCSNSMSGVRLGAIQCEGGSAQKNIGFENIIITNNIVKNLDASGQLTDAIMVASGKNVIISNNIVSETHYGITVGESEGVHISNNIIEKPKMDGINILRVKNVINVNNNSVFAPGSGGVGISGGIKYHVLEDVAYSKVNVMISDNYILLSEMVAPVLSTRGIWVWTPATLKINMGNVTIKNNEIDDRNASVYGIKVESKPFFNWLIDGNRGWKTSAEGTAIIEADTDLATFNHGLAEAPTLVQLTGTTIETTDLYVTSLNWNANTQIRIKNKTPVTADTTIYWKAEIKY